MRGERTVSLVLSNRVLMCVEFTAVKEGELGRDNLEESS